MSEKPYTEIIRDEYYSLQKDKTNIALLMMVKNEHKRIKVSLNSVIGHVDCMIIFDTGSEDDTVNIFQEFCKEHQINLYLIQGEFVNFSVSRNISLEYADTIDNVNYLLLLDCNDELRGGEYLREFAEENKDDESTGFLICQEWWSRQYDKYYNMRFVKAREGWRYRGRVHEWMKNTKYPSDDEAPPIKRIPDKTVLYQDRTADDNKSGKRFNRDKILLLEDHKEDPTEPRTAFYLAQTCACLNENEEAYYYYKIRTTLEGFQEEKFHAFLRCGELSEKMKHPWTDSMGWYIKAFEHSERVEPLIKIAEHYQHIRKWVLSFTFVDLACKLKYPEQSILFVDKHAYDYKRWHIMGIVAFYLEEFKKGKEACQKAIDCGINEELDKNNMKFYLEKEKELEEQFKKNTTTLSKNEFINLHIPKIKNDFSNLTQKQLYSKVNKLWKKYRDENKIK